MTHAELLRKHATDATNEGGMWFSGEYMTMLASMAESIEAENAALRTQLADATESMGRVEERCAKLRELTKDMFACISHANEADWFYFERDKTGCGMSCTVNGEGCGLLVLADRMRELSVEADR